VTPPPIPSDVFVAFARALRAHGGIRPSPAQVITYQTAVSRLGRPAVDELYWIGRACLGVAPAQRATYDRTFTEFFLGEDTGMELALPTEPTTADAGSSAGSSGPAAPPTPVAGPGGGDGDEQEGTPVGAEASVMEVLNATPFAACTEEELAILRALVRRLRVMPPSVLSRRARPASRSGTIDLRRTVRRAMKTYGDPVDLAWRRRRTRPRRIVMLIDVSRSMGPYARQLLHFAYAVSASGLPVEVVCFGTRTTRVTRILRRHRSAAALERAAAAVLDWDGGTRIGESLRRAQSISTVRAALRGSVVVVFSDGLEQDDPELLRLSMARLHRTSHAVLWVNPLAGDPRYAPLTAGMVAAMPYVDQLLAGDTLEALTRVARALSALA
jgi:uncharacterized protein with von Willebrand factor type A (vWA) domain